VADGSRVLSLDCQTVKKQAKSTEVTLSCAQTERALSVGDGRKPRAGASGAEDIEVSTIDCGDKGVEQDNQK